MLSRARAALLPLALVIAAVASFATSDAQARVSTLTFHAAAETNPSANIAASPAYPAICESAPSGQACEDSALAALNNARSVMGQAAYALPSNFETLPAAYQLEALANSDRAQYGLSPINGLNPTLTAAAQAAIAADSDPTGPTVVDGQHYTAWSANWAAGWASPLYTYYEWMYDDGMGSSNADCTSTNGSGCWGHRIGTLRDFGSAFLAMGVGGGTSPRYGRPAFTELFEAFPGAVGLTQTDTSPIGNVEALTQTSSGISVSGWALDPDTQASIRVDVYADGVGLGSITANGPRSDVATVMRDGSAHGFSASFPLGQGVHTVCVYAIDANGSNNSLLSCRAIALDFSPVGYVDSVSVSASGVSLSGWAFDRDVTGSPVRIDVYDGGTGLGSTTANLSRPDVASLFGIDAAHGFSTTFPLTGGGAHNICAYAINLGAGNNVLLQCRTVIVYVNPVGSLDSVSQSPYGVSVTGWALDPNSTGAIRVDVYADGVGLGSTTAGGNRPDVDAAFHDGPQHGFSASFPLSRGGHIVCAYGINVGPGSNVLLGCRAVVIS